MAVVSRGGRPELAGEAFARVEAPTLLIVGGHDEPLIDPDRKDFDRSDELQTTRSQALGPRANSATCRKVRSGGDNDWRSGPSS